MTRSVSCPHCGASVEWTTNNPARPFCSERCKLIDLGAWASERYRIVTDDAETQPTETFQNESRLPPG